MAKKKKQEWKLDWADIDWGGGSSSCGKSGQFERKLKTTSCNIFLIHKPTGIRVKDEVPPGNYSKKEMMQLRDNLKQSLFLKLEYEVAKKLKISGR